MTGPSPRRCRSRRARWAPMAPTTPPLRHPRPAGPVAAARRGLRLRPLEPSPRRARLPCRDQGLLLLRAVRPDPRDGGRPRHRAHRGDLPPRPARRQPRARRWPSRRPCHRSRPHARAAHRRYAEWTPARMLASPPRRLRRGRRPAHAPRHRPRRLRPPRRRRLDRAGREPAHHRRHRPRKELDRLRPRPQGLQGWPIRPLPPHPEALRGTRHRARRRPLCAPSGPSPGPSC